ncbi:hypothetical protein F183_A12630 [Bryobacterales bacterium F-183]|nr:hypothetical protein F183_A12630 [Bryobacterales bacterium F-183]
MRARIALLSVLLASAAIAQADASKACGGCHKEIWESYQKTGMGRSFALPTAQNTPLPAQPYFHEASDSYFQMLFRDGAWFQRRHQLDPTTGRETNIIEKRVDYVLGSGNHARTYLHRTPANTLVELPLGWYAEKGGYWAMNPGYDRPDHEGFRRQVTYDCMFCHNAYPTVPPRNTKPGEDAVYGAELPQGIDCARCHGSGGAKHMELAGRPGTSRELVRQAIVNPKRLTADRQMEVCMSCHLETTSFPLPGAILRHNRGPFSFRPGEPLADYILNFDHAKQAGRSDKFEIVNSVYRLRQSACYLKSSGKMQCTTCHNPHHAPRGEDAAKQYDKACRQCHSGDALSKASHPQTSKSCVECHMPKRRTEDVIHVAMTDHLIARTPPPGDLLAERKERIDEYRGPVVPYYPPTLAGSAEAELYLAVAQVKQRANLETGIAQLTAAIRRYAPQRAEWYLELAEALENHGELSKAVPWYREATRRDPTSAIAWQKLGAALRRSSQPAEAITALRRSTTLSAARAYPWLELGLTYQALGRAADSAAAFEKAIARDADLPEAHSNLGILRFQSGDVAKAEAAFREAIRIQPNYADAHYNYAMLLGKTGRYDAAQRELEACLRANAKFADAHELLGDLLMARNQQTTAVGHYREAVRLRPASMRAVFGLGLSLAVTGNVAEAVTHLRKAAAGPDADFRERAADVLRQMGR